MTKRAYYKEDDKEGAIFLRGITKEQFSLLCELLNVSINDINGLEKLPLDNIPDMPMDYAEEPESEAKPVKELEPVEEMAGFDPDELTKSFAAMFDAKPEQVSEDRNNAASEATGDEPEPASVSNPEPETETKVEIPDSGKIETENVKPETSDNNRKYVFSILKVGESAISSPAKAVNSMKAYAEKEGIHLCSEGAKMYVTNKTDKEKLEKVYTFIKEE